MCARLLLLGCLAIRLISAAVPAKSTEILWDRFGVPRLFATDQESLFFALGADMGLRTDRPQRYVSNAKPAFELR